jgi:hypothetical protein
MNETARGMDFSANHPCVKRAAPYGMQHGRFPATLTAKVAFHAIHVK